MLRYCVGIFLLLAVWSSAAPKIEDGELRSLQPSAQRVLARLTSELQREDDDEERDEDASSWTNEAGDSCEWYLRNDPGCLHYADYGQLSHCRRTCKQGVKYGGQPLHAAVVAAHPGPVEQAHLDNSLSSAPQIQQFEGMQHTAFPIPINKAPSITSKLLYSKKQRVEALKKEVERSEAQLKQLEKAEEEEQKQELVAEKARAELQEALQPVLTAKDQEIADKDAVIANLKAKLTTVETRVASLDDTQFASLQQAQPQEQHPPPPRKHQPPTRQHQPPAQQHQPTTEQPPKRQKKDPPKRRHSW